MNLHRTRHLIPTWLLWAVAIAGLLLLVLIPGPADAAPLEDYPPALPLDPLPPEPNPWLVWGVPLGSFAVIGVGLALAAATLREPRRRPTAVATGIPATDRLGA